MRSGPGKGDCLKLLARGAACAIAFSQFRVARPFWPIAGRRPGRQLARARVGLDPASGVSKVPPLAQSGSEHGQD